jgi:hypothetical protein
VTEQEVELRRYWDAVAARWWLPLAGLVAGAVIGYALSIGGGDVWRGQALVYLGQPVAASGAQVQSLGTNASAASEIASAGPVQRRVARATGISRSDLAAGLSVTAVQGNVTRLGQNPLVRVRVEGDTRRVARAASLLAEQIVDAVSGYADKKIEILREAVDDGEADLALAERQSARATGSDRLALLLWRAELREQLLEAKEDLALAEEIERARVVEPAIARKVTAQSRRNQIVVGAVLGLLLGLIAALLWESAAALRRR